MFKTAFLQKMSITWKFYDRFFSKISVNKPQTACKRAQQLPTLLRQPQADHSLLVGAVVYWNLSNDILLFIEEIHMSNTVAIICSKMQNLKQSVDSNPPISVSRPNKHPCAGQGCGFELPTVAIRWLLDLNWRTYLKCLWLRFLHRWCWESWSCNFRIAFLEKFWKDWALIRMGHGYISGGWGAGIFEVRN